MIEKAPQRQHGTSRRGHRDSWAVGQDSFHCRLAAQLAYQIAHTTQQKQMVLERATQLRVVDLTKHGGIMGHPERRLKCSLSG